MKLLFNNATTISSKVPPIKAIRGLLQMQLKEAKEFVEEAMENGSATVEGYTYSPSTVHTNMLYSNGFTLVTAENELVEALNNALDVATRLRKYDTIRTIIDTIQTLRE